MSRAELNRPESALGFQPSPAHRRPICPLGPEETDPEYTLGRPADEDYVNSLREAIPHLALRTFRRTQRTLADGRYLPKVERDLEVVASELGELSGWCLFDSERQDEARQLNMEALALARMAGDVPMEWFVLSNQAMASVHTGRSREGLRIADRVLERGGLPGLVSVIFGIRRARALARLGDEHWALREFDRTRSLLTAGATSRDPMWTWWITEQELAWHKGMMFGALGDWTASVPYFAAGMELPGQCRRGLFIIRRVATMVARRAPATLRDILHQLAAR